MKSLYFLIFGLIFLCPQSSNANPWASIMTGFLEESNKQDEEDRNQEHERQMLMQQQQMQQEATQKQWLYNCMLEHPKEKCMEVIRNAE